MTNYKYMIDTVLGVKCNFANDSSWDNAYYFKINNKDLKICWDNSPIRLILFYIDYGYTALNINYLSFSDALLIIRLYLHVREEFFR